MNPIATAPPRLPYEGLGLLFDQLAREGWLSGLNTDVDLALVRMDPKTGIYSREYLLKLLQEAIADSRGARKRLLDGPDSGRVALVTLRVRELEDPTTRWSEDVRTVFELEAARRLVSCLRAEDSLGRDSMDTFVLLLRGCPPEQLDFIAERCRGAVEEVPITTPGGPVHLTTRAAVSQWSGEDAAHFHQRAMDDLHKAVSTDV